MRSNKQAATELILGCYTPDALKRNVDRFLGLANLPLPTFERAQEVVIDMQGLDEEMVRKLHRAMLTVSFAREAISITLARHL